MTGGRSCFGLLSFIEARLLKKANVHVEEDLSKRTRENRAELRKFMRQVSGKGETETEKTPTWP